MTISTTALMRAGLAVATLLLSGCVTQPKPLYYWGDYQPQLYAYFQGDGNSPEQQREALEKTAAQASAKGAALPPGFHAHLGLLYLRMGQPGPARTAFMAEEARFPESKPYMDFLIGNLNRTQAEAP